MIRQISFSRLKARSSLCDQLDFNSVNFTRNISTFLLKLGNAIPCIFDLTARVFCHQISVPTLNGLLTQAVCYYLS